MESKQVTILNTKDGDWAWLYVDGVLMYEGHSLSAEDVLPALGIEYEYLWGNDLEYTTYVPVDWSELKNVDMSKFEE